MPKTILSTDTETAYESGGFALSPLPSPEKSYAFWIKLQPLDVISAQQDRDYADRKKKYDDARVEQAKENTYELLVPNTPSKVMIARKKDQEFKELRQILDNWQEKRVPETPPHKIPSEVTLVPETPEREMHASKTHRVPKTPPPKILSEVTLVPETPEREMPPSKMRRVSEPRDTGDDMDEADSADDASTSSSIPTGPSIQYKPYYEDDISESSEYTPEPLGYSTAQQADDCA